MRCDWFLQCWKVLSAVETTRSTSHFFGTLCGQVMGYWRGTKFPSLLAKSALINWDGNGNVWKPYRLKLRLWIPQHDFSQFPPYFVQQRAEEYIFGCVEKARWEKVLFEVRLVNLGKCCLSEERHPYSIGWEPRRGHFFVSSEICIKIVGTTTWETRISTLGRGIVLKMSVLSPNLKKRRFCIFFSFFTAKPSVLLWNSGLGLKDTQVW